MIHPKPDVFTADAHDGLADLRSRLARGTRALLGFIGFLLLCLAAGGEEVRRHGKKFQHHVNMDG